MSIGNVWGAETIFSATFKGSWSQVVKESDNNKVVPTDNVTLSPSGVSAIAYTTRTGSTGRTAQISSNAYNIAVNADLFLKLVLASGTTIQEGDVIRLNGTSNKTVVISDEASTSSKPTASTNTDYVVPEGSALIGKGVVYLTRSTSSTTLTSITIVRLDNITLNANGGKVNGENSIVYGMMEAGILPRAERGSMRFVGWYDDPTAGTLKANAFAKYTPSGNTTLYAHYADDCASSGEIYSFSINPKPAADIKAAAAAGSVVELVDYADCDGKGTASIGNNSANQYVYVKSSDGKVYLTGSNSYLKLELACPLEEGDEITFVKSNALKISYTYNAASGTTSSLASGTNTFTIPAESGWIGKRAIYCFYNNNGVNITSVTITRPAPACTAPTSPTITATPASAAYTVGDNISLTASATGTGGSTTYTWYKGIDWATASAGSSIGSAATYTKNSCVEGDAGTYWCNISNGTGCEVQVSKTITVAAAAKAYTVTAASTNDSFGTAEAAASALDEDETTTVTATAEDGYKFVSWDVSGTGASLSSTTDNPTTLTMGTADATVTATFRALYTYEISYAKGSAEGVTGSKAAESKTEDVAFTLPGTAVFEREGYIQSGWATSDGGSKDYELGGSYTTNSAQAFYPVWTELKKVVYHANGGSGTMSPTQGLGETKLSDNTYTKTGYVFAGWATSQSNADAGTIAYTDGANVTLSSEDIDLYAVWYTPLYSFAPTLTEGSLSANDVVATSTGGSMTFTPIDSDGSATLKYSGSGLEFGKNSKSAATVTMTNAITEGSLIIAKIHIRDKNTRGLKLCTGSATTDLTEGAWSWVLTDADTPTPETKVCTYTVNSTSALKNATSFRLVRNNTAYLQSLVVAKFLAQLDAITGLAVSATTSTSLTFEWDAVTNASSYDVYLYEDEDCETLVGSKANVTTTSKEFTGLTPNTDYYCKVQAIGDGVSYTDGPLSDYRNGKTDEAPKYDVTYESTKGVAPAAAEQVYSVLLPQISPVTGFVHTGWTADKTVVVDEETVIAETTIAIGKTAVLSANTTFTAVWTTAYTLTLDPKGGACASYTGWTYDSENDKYTKEVASGTEVTLPTFTKTNRTFKTWRNNADAEDEYAEEGSVTVSADMTLNAIWNAMVEQVIYSWEGAESGAIEFGGTAVGSEAGLVNTLSEGYYCLRMNGNTDYDKYVEITLSGDEKIKTGDKITYLGFYSNASDKNASPKMRDSNGSKAEIFDDSDNLPKINGGVGTPAQRTFTVPEGINTNKVQMTRSKTGSSTMMPKIRIYREVTTEEDNIKTVTFNSNGGSDVSAAEVISGKVVAMPADPTRAGYRFKEWKLSGSAYNFSTAVTENITLDADWTQLYAVTYAAGEGSGSMVADAAAEGDKVTLKANGFTAPDGKVFDAWVVAPTAGGDPITVTAGKFTMPAEAVTVTATWKATFTVNYYDEDGETSLGSEEVAVGSHPTAAGISAEKEFKMLTWLLNSEAVELDEVSAAAGETVELVASYAPAYASSINIEQWVLDNRKNNTAFRAVLDSRYYKYANLNDLDSLTAEKNEGDRNYPFLGQKWKLATSEISFLLKEGSTVKVRFGNMGSSVNVKIGSADAVELTSGNYANSSLSSSKEYSYTATEDVVVKFQGTGTGTVVFKQIMIDEAIASIKLPAVVTYDANGGSFGKTSEKYTGTPLVIADATPADEDYEFEGWHVGSVEGEKINAAAYEPTANVTLVAKYVAKPSPFSLSTLTFTIGAGEAQEVGYVEGTYEYDVKLPYAGSYETITVAYTLAEGTSSEKAGAVLSVTSVPGAATFTIVAANSTEKTYTVNFIKDAKDGLEIIGAAVTGNTTATVTGLYKGTASVKLSDLKIDKGDYYIYVTLKEGQTLQNGDVLVVDVNAKSDIGTKALEICTGTGNLDNGILTSVAVDDYSTGENSIVLASVPAGATSIGLKRSDNLNAKIDGLKVYRPMNPVLKSITFDGTKINVASTTVEETLPYATDLSEVTPEIFWNGAGTAVVTTNEGAWAWGENTYVLTDKDGDATTYTISLTRAERSTDATLSSLSVNGNAMELVADKYEYTYEYPYGTDPATVPVVAAEANDAHKHSMDITQATNATGTAEIVVVAEDETTTLTYTVRFCISRNQTLVIYDGKESEPMNAIANPGSLEPGLEWTIKDPNSTSASSADAVVFEGKSYKKYVQLFTSATKAPNEGNTRYMTITVPENYLAKFRLVGCGNGSGDRSLFISKEITGTLDESIAFVHTTSATITGMTSDYQYPGTYYLCCDASIRIYELSVTLYPIDYNRDVTQAQGLYGTICLPNGGIMVGGTLFEVAYMTYENAQPYKVFFDEVIDGIMEPAVPYIFLPKEDASLVAVTYTDNANATPSVEGVHGLHGTLEQMNGEDLYGKYIFYNNSIFKSENPNNWLNANRAYIQLDEVPDYVTPVAQGRRRVSMGFNGTNTATGMENINASEKPVKLMINGQIYILRGEKMYDVTGKLVK